ncbi:MAG: prephenate dehydrogenase [Chloroflexi bacterium]|nr:prephenate dehydrogenase [Chloroflexota bacterium]
MRIGIIGLGAMGASIGLALRSQRGWEDVTGYDTSARVQNAAKRRGAIREGTSSIPDLLDDAGIVVLAVPGPAVIQFLQEYGFGLRPDTILIDTSILKAEIMRAAERYVPLRSGFVGSHPLISCPPGIEAASGHIFRGCRWCICPLRQTDEAQIARISALIEATGAHPYFVDATEHDSWIAATHALPLLLDASVFRLARRSDAWHEIARASDLSFEQCLRTLSTRGNMVHEVLLTGGPALVSWLDRLQDELQQWREAIVQRDPAFAREQSEQAPAILESWERERRSSSSERR